MKIIGTIGRDSLLVEMSENEIARLHGVDFASEIPICTRSDERFRVGREYDVSKIYFRLKGQEQAAKQLDSAAGSLRALADLIETIKPAAELLSDDGRCVMSNPAVPQHGLTSDPETLARMSLCQGLTKREWLAGNIMAGFLANSKRWGSNDTYVKEAVTFADALIAELAKEGAL